MPETTYIVLRQRAANGAMPLTYEEVGKVTASGAEGAIRKGAAALNPADGSYVATPMRSWKPLRVTAATKTVLNLSEETGGGTSP